MMIGKKMNKYNQLTLLRRCEVIEVFKTGIIYPVHSIPFACSLESLAQNDKEFKKLFSKIRLIEYSSDYFIIYAQTEKKASVCSQGLRIEDINLLIPLDRQAAHIGLSLNPSIKFYHPIFEKHYLNFQLERATENAQKGIDDISKLFGFEKLQKTIKGFSEKSLKRAIALLLDENGTESPESIWEYLLCYTRNYSYPNDIRGAFLDTMSVLSSKKRNKRDQTTTTTGRNILAYPTPSYHNLLICLEGSDKFIREANEAYKDFWKIAPLYFMLLDFFSNISSDGSSVKGQSLSAFISNVLRCYDHLHLKPALLMLSITLGHSTLYKCIYSQFKDEYNFLL